MPAGSWTGDDAQTAGKTLPMEVNSAGIRALVTGLVRPDLVIYPVRHHSPACAWYLRQLFDLVSPSVVLVEGPCSFTPLIPLLTNPAARMPLAVYTYAVRRTHDEKPESRRAAYYPFCDYSPELVALREAEARGIPARFIDLDYAHQSRPDSGEDEPESLLEERYYKRSGYLGSLAKSCSCRDHEELWEHLFETSISPDGLDRHIERMAAYCHFARIDSSDDELERDGTHPREAEMAWNIQQALADIKPGAGPVLAVMGGFHAVAMPALLAAPVKRPAAPKGSIPDSSASLIRYSFDRLDRLNGYSAGMTSPAWHQLLWERLSAYDRAGLEHSAKIRQGAALEMLFEIALELRRRHGVRLPVPMLTAAYEQALLLAELRQRHAPLREDVMDAVVSCFIKGDADADGAVIRATAERIFGGLATGVVPTGADTPPLVRDFARRAARQKLKIEDSEPRRVNLDIYRRPIHRITSRLLHSLAFLGIPFAFRSAGPDFINGTGLERMLEHWEYTYSSATEGALVEASVYGETVPLATANRFALLLDRTDAANKDARAASRLMIQACLLGLHDHLPRLLALFRDAVGCDSAFESVAGAAGSIGLLWESREPLEAHAVPEIPLLLRAAFERAIYLGNNLPEISPNAPEVIQGLSKLRELLVSAAGQTLDAELYWNLVRILCRNHRDARICGAASGLLYGSGRLPVEEMAALLSGFLSGNTAPHESVAYLRGLLFTAREVAWQQPLLLEILDRKLARLDEKSFVELLPELRLAFAEMTPKETDRIAEAVAELHGAGSLSGLLQYDIAEEAVLAHLGLSVTVREVLEDEGLQGWFEP